MNIPFEEFKRFEVSLSNFRDRENPYDREGERAHVIFGVLIFNGLVVILYALYILILMCI